MKIWCWLSTCRQLLTLRRVYMIDQVIDRQANVVNEKHYIFCSKAHMKLNQDWDHDREGFDAPNEPDEPDQCKSATPGN